VGGNGAPGLSGDQSGEEEGQAGHYNTRKLTAESDIFYLPNPQHSEAPSKSLKIRSR
jgi:hypothetical protein